MSNKRPLGAKAPHTSRRELSPTRRKLEVASVRPLLRLQRLPWWLLPIAMGLLLLAGLLIASAWAGVFLVALAVFLGWLVALSWPVLPAGARILRTVVVAVVASAALLRLTGRM